MEHDPAKRTSSSSSRPPVVIEGILLIVGAAWAIAGVAAAALRIVTAVQTQDSDMVQTATSAVLMVLGGVSAMAFFWTLAGISRRQFESSLRSRRTLGLLEQMSTQLHSSASRGIPTNSASSDGASMQRVLSELAEVNANLLLTEPQRETKRRTVQLKRGMELAKDVMAALDADRLQQAEQTLRKLGDEVPDYPDMSTLEQLLQQRRHALMEHEVQELSLRVRDLMSAGSFDKALATARLLAERYPQSRGLVMVEDVQREKTAFENERRGMMYSQINKFVETRQWRSALAAARQFLDAHPNSPEADLIRAQMSTLKDNAQIEEVRHLRDEFRDHVGGKRFAEAYEVARDLVNRFPGTAAAEELRPQMDRLAARAQVKTPQ